MKALTFRGWIMCLGFLFLPLTAAAGPDERGGGCACDGDLDNTGHSSVDDIVLAADCVCAGGGPGCDVDCDGDVDLHDFGAVVCQFYQLPSPACCEMSSGACCGADVTFQCYQTDAVTCGLFFGGVYLGDGTACPSATECGTEGFCENDCTCNGVIDICEQLPDCDQDRVPDECEADCNGNGMPDDCDGYFLCWDGDACSCDACTGSGCGHTPIQYGDVDCSGGRVDLNDILCVLNGYSNPRDCPNSDLVPCTGGGGFIDIDDILAILDAFSGVIGCGCP